MPYIVCVNIRRRRWHIRGRLILRAGLRGSHGKYDQKKKSRASGKDHRASHLEGILSAAAEFNGMNHGFGHAVGHRFIGE